MYRLIDLKYLIPTRYHLYTKWKNRIEECESRCKKSIFDNYYIIGQRKYNCILHVLSSHLMKKGLNLAVAF